MDLQHIKMTVSAAWILIALAITIITGPSLLGGIFLAVFGLLPPLALLLLWNDPAKTMSESIDEARRR